MVQKIIEPVGPVLAAQNPLLYGGSPIHLTAVCTLSSTGTAISPNTDALRNPRNEPMEIHAIKFELQTTSGAGPSGADVTAAFALKDQAGNVVHKITNNFVPVWVIGKSTGNVAAETNTDGSGFSSAEYIWQLDYPMYVPPGYVLEAQFQHTGQINNTPTMRVSYSGRSGVAKRSTTWMPYVASWTSKPFTNATTADSDNSQETDLQNSLDVPLRVRRFVGRIGYSLLDAGSNTVISDQNFPDLAQSIFTARMFESEGFPVIPVDTIWANIFQWLHRAWEIDDELQPGGYYQLFLTKNASTYTFQPVVNGSANNITYITIFASAAMIGYREVAI